MFAFQDFEDTLSYITDQLPNSALILRAFKERLDHRKLKNFPRDVKT